VCEETSLKEVPRIYVKRHCVGGRNWKKIPIFEFGGDQEDKEELHAPTSKCACMKATTTTKFSFLALLLTCPMRALSA